MEIPLPISSAPVVCTRNQNLRILSLVIGAMVLAFISDVSANGISLFGFPIPTLCAFKLLTGFDCPGCGLTRAVGLALRGDFYQSYLLHLWGIPFAMVLLAQLPYRLGLIFSNRKRFPPLPALYRSWFNRVLILSLTVPWLLKTAAVFSVRFL